MMTKEEMRAAIEYGRYDYVTDPMPDTSTISVYGQRVAIDREAKTATYCVTIKLTDAAVREVERRMLEKSINDKKSELSALEIQLENLDKED